MNRRRPIYAAAHTAWVEKVNATPPPPPPPRFACVCGRGFDYQGPLNLHQRHCKVAKEATHGQHIE